MKNLIFCVLMALSSASFAQSFSETGCQLYASVAASAAMERQGKAPLGATLQALASRGFTKEGSPGRIWELFEHVIAKALQSKENEHAVYAAELAACFKAGGDVGKLIPGKV